MTPQIHNAHPKKATDIPVVKEVVRPHRKALSRYKLKKQTGIMMQILGDQQIS